MKRRTTMSGVNDARRVLAGAIAARVFPAASAEVGTSDQPLWQEALGTFTFDDPSPAAAIQTPFDLASLTKVIATTTVMMLLVHQARVRLDEPVSVFFAEWRGVDREHVTVRDLLEHASGLPARLVDAPPEGRREFEHDICTMPLEYAPRARSIYSDLGFILLGFLAADRGGASLDRQFDDLKTSLNATVRPKPDTARQSSVYDDLYQRGPYGGADLEFALGGDSRRGAAPTLPLDDDARRGRSLAGEVHDNYAAALGGVAGHAGLFGSAPAVGGFARTVLRAARGDDSGPAPFTPPLVREFLRKSAVPGSSRALGWDTMLPTSSCGTRMSPSAFGHTGFTGTSLWIDPARDRYFVLLTNRAHGGGTREDMRSVRRAFHDALKDL